VVKDNSKYYSQKDYYIAKKSIAAIEKSQWSTALSTSKKQKINQYITLFNGDIY